ncbi:MAG: NAD+ synthase [Geminicoccaceae bacterium]
MSDKLRIVLAQVNPTVGAIDANRQLILDCRRRAADQGALLVVFPELVLCGYPPEDLVLKPALQKACHAALEALARATEEPGPALLIGAPWRQGDALWNASVLLGDGKMQAVRGKHLLPNYGVFDEKRVFDAAQVPGPMILEWNDRAVRLGVMVCEDMWAPDVAEALGECGADLLIVINGSPFDTVNDDLRLQEAVARVTETGLGLIYVNLVGGQDELCFDGASFVLNANRRFAAQAEKFETQLLATDWSETEEGWWCQETAIAPMPGDDEAIYGAMVLGLRDYVEKNGFPGVVLGLSGGIDSALSAAVAVDALGAERVHAVMLPSRYTSQHSLDDAAALASRLGIRLDEIAIEEPVAAINRVLAPLFEGLTPGLTEENIQSRVRGLILMALSNKLGPMVLTTGNKSEMSTGYATLYGDMCGGYSVLKDVYKTTVFRLSAWRNRAKPRIALGPDGEVIPERIITKPPSAELRDNQTDQDSLPPYDLLDSILRALVEGEQHVEDLVNAGYEQDSVERAQQLLDRAEYKRRQAPPGVKLTQKAFGRDRRYPITNAFRRPKS